MCLCQMNMLSYKIWSQLYMPITSCICQQIFMVFRTLACLSAYEQVHISNPNHWLSEAQTNPSRRGECNLASMAGSLPSAMRACL